MPVFITLACVLFPIDDDLPVRRQNVRDGVAIPVLGVKHPIFVVQRIATGVPGVPKNLIFASIKTKPELYFIGAINKITIRNYIIFYLSWAKYLIIDYLAQHIVHIYQLFFESSGYIDNSAYRDYPE